MLSLFHNTTPAPPLHAPQAQHYTPRAVRAQLASQTPAQPGRCPGSPAAPIYHMQHIASPCPALPTERGCSSCSHSAASPVPDPRGEPEARPGLTGRPPGTSPALRGPPPVPPGSTGPGPAALSAGPPGGAPPHRGPEEEAEEGGGRWRHRAPRGPEGPGPGLPAHLVQVLLAAAVFGVGVDEDAAFPLLHHGGAGCPPTARPPSPPTAAAAAAAARRCERPGLPRAARPPGTQRARRMRSAPGREAGRGG